ncbi:MAG: glycosyltransferase family 4 protein [Sedimentisphaerales bacterium]|nr:glycosyltransferase family 4 protein [Sedimentisphaerales bacterium]
MIKKVAIIIERANISLGGAERSVFELAAALSGLGLKVNVLAATGQPNTKNVTILCQDKPGLRVKFSVFAEALQEHLAKNNYDIVHSVLPFEFADVYQPRGGTYAETIQRHIASFQNPLIKSYKEITAWTNFRRSALLQAERQLSRRTDGPMIVALSEYVAEQFKKHYGTDDKRIIVIPNGVKTERRVDKDRADRLRTQILTKVRLRESDHPILFLFVAHNFRLKGLGVLLKAMSLIARRKTKQTCCLVIVGSDKTRKYRRFAKRVNTSTTSPRVIFLGHFSHIQSILSIADVAVLPTFYDPSSRFILEALGAGKPVITTKFNGASDLFVDQRHGRVIDRPENIEALAEAIGWFTEPDNIQKASHAIAEDNLKENVSVSRVARQLMDVYESIFNRKGEK